MNKKHLEVLLHHQVGREFIADIINDSGFLCADYTSEPRELAYQAGRRVVGHMLFNLIMYHFPEKIGEVLAVMNKNKDVDTQQ